MRRRVIAAVALVIVALVLAVALGIAARELMAERPPGIPKEATHVYTFRNARGLPDGAIFCLDRWGFFYTAEATPRVDRLYEYDEICDPGKDEPAGP